MKPKKTKKADLNNYSSTFMLIGLVVVLFASLKAINLKTQAPKIDLDKLNVCKMNMDETKVIKIEEIKPQKTIKIKPRVVAKLEVIKDDSKKVESELLPTDPDEKPVVPVDNLKTEIIEDDDVEIPYVFVEQVPAFPGCKGNNEQLKKCLNEKIRQFINRKFNTEIAQEMGLSGERVKILTQFTIDKDGRIIQIKTRSKYKDLEEEARRVIQKLPRMQPGKQRGIPVKVTYTLPIIFDVAE